MKTRSSQFRRHQPVTGVGVLWLWLVVSLSTTWGQSPGPADLRIPALEDPQRAQQTLSLDFRDVDIRTVLQTIGDLTGLNFVVDEAVQGKVTVLSPTEIAMAEVYPVLQSILEVHGFSAVPSGGVVKVIPKSQAAHQRLPVRYGADPNEIPVTDEMVTQILPLQIASAAAIEPLIEPHISEEAKITVFANTNSVIVTDTSANIHHVATLIQALDRRLVNQRPAVFHARNVSAAVLKEQIQSVLRQRSANTTGPARRSDEDLDALGLYADAQTNNLIVTAGPGTLEFVRQLVAQLDVPLTEDQQTVHVLYLNNAEPNEVAASLNSILADLGRLTPDNRQAIRISADAGTNALIVQAPAHEYPTIERIVQKLDVVREQVMVEMYIVEVSEDDLTEVGIDWATMDDPVTYSLRGFAGTQFGPRLDYLSGDLEGLGVGLWRSLGGETKIGAILHMLQQQSKVNILSSPHLITSNHRKASIVVGENRAFVVKANITETYQSDPTVIKDYEYKDVGITLEITPHVSQSGRVRLELTSVFSKLIADVANLASDTPATARREVKTMISLQSGETTVIGGLIRDDTDIVEQKVPFLGDLPLIGAAFKTQSERKTKTNLLIFITPHVLATPDERAAMGQRQQSRFEQASGITVTPEESGS